MADAVPSWAQAPANTTVYEPGDFDAPEFKTGVDKNIDKTEADSKVREAAMSPPSWATTQVTAKEDKSKPSWATEKPKSKDISWGQAAKAAGSEFQGAADVILGTPAFVVEGLTTPLLAVGEAIKGTKDPIQTAEAKMQGFQQSQIGKIISLSTAENLGNKEGVAKSTVNEIFGKLTDGINNTADKLGKGSEKAAAGRIGANFAMAALGGIGLREGAGALAKDTPKAKPTTTPSKVARPQFEAGKLTRVPMKNIVPKDPIAEFMQKSVDHEVEQHPVTEAAKEVFDPYAGKEPEDVMKEHLRNVLATQHEAETWGKSIEESVPNPVVRERIFKALGKEGKHDNLITDKDKQLLLEGDGSPRLDAEGKKIPIGRDETGTMQYATNDGMKGAHRNMQGKLANGRLQLSQLANGFPIKGRQIFKDEAEANKYSESIPRTEAAIKQLEARPSEDLAIPVFEKIKATLNNIGEKAKAAGVIGGMLDNYVTHMLDWKDFKGTEVQKQALLDKLFSAPKDPKLSHDFSVERHYKTVKDLEKAVEGTGVIVQKDIAKVAEAYMKSMTKAILEKQMIDHFLNEKTTLMPHGLLTRDLQVGLMEKYVPFVSRNAKPLQGILVHPDFSDLMKYAFESKDPNEFIRGAGNISMALKGMQTTASLFHLKSLLEARYITAPSLLVKDIFTAGAGIRHAKEAFAKGDGGALRIDGWIKNGLVLSSEDAARGALAKLGVYTDELLSKLGPQVKLTQLATEPFDKHVLQNFNTLTWDYAHTGGKISLANHLFAKIKGRNPSMPDEKIMQEVSSFVNNTLGGLDWLEVASHTNNHFLKTLAMKANSIQGRQIGQILLFAPDWTVSTLRSVSEALPRELSKPQNWNLLEGVKGFYNPKTRHDLARRYVFNTAITYFTVMNGLNYALSGHYLWDNKDPYRLDLGDGTTMQMAKHAMEVPEMFGGAIKNTKGDAWTKEYSAFGKAVGNKLGFIPKTISTLAVGRTNPFTATSSIKNDSATKRIGTVLESMLPFPASGAAQAPIGEGMKRAAWSMAGAPIYGETNAKNTSHKVRKERALARAKTRLENLKKKKEERQH